MGCSINEKSETKINYSVGRCGEDSNSYITEVRTCSNPNLIAIIVQHRHQFENIDSVLIWDTEANREMHVFDVSEPYELLWDKQGNTYIVTQSKIIFTKEISASTAYQYQNLTDISEQLKNQSLAKGHRFDDKNHNWLIL